MTGLTAPSDVGASAVGASAQTPLCVGERNAEQKPAKRTPSWLFWAANRIWGPKPREIPRFSKSSRSWYTGAGLRIPANPCYSARRLFLS